MNTMIPNLDLRQKGYKLLLAIYRLVDVFPEETRHSIGSELKASANGVLTKIAISKFDLAYDKILETLSNLEVARGLELAQSINFQILTHEYQKLAEEILPRLSLARNWQDLVSGKVSGKKEKLKSQKLTSRQKKIVQDLKNSGKINFGQVRQMFLGVSSRTLRLDLKDLLAKKIIHKNGKSVRTYYTPFKD